MATISEPAFSKWRSRLWPIYNFELKKLLPMFLMFFFISFNYTILRDTKDTLIITAPGSGAEAIPFLKVWGTLPIAVLFMLLYAKLSNKLSKTALFYSMITPFLVFFALFPTVLYPLRDYLHPNAFCDHLQQILPIGFMGLIAILRNWTFALFYILSELWGSAVLSLMFWGFANDIMKVTEAKRFYSVLGLGANLALVVSGPTVTLLSNIRRKLPPDVDAWGVSLNLLMGMVVLAGLSIIAIYYWINKNVLTDSRFYNPNEQKMAKKEKPKMSMKESFLFLVRSKYIACIALIVLAYGISINLIEVTWKGQLKLQYPNSNDYNAFMGYLSLFTGITTSFMALFVGGNVIRRFGWGIAAMITPVILFITGMFFLSFIVFRTSLTHVIAYLGTTPLMMAVVFGMVQNIMSKATKYTLFDPTKEMSYIPLDQESKVKGKAAVDVVGARLGKSGGSLIQQGLILVLGSVAMITPYVVGCLAVITIIWVYAVKALNKQFLQVSAQREAEREAEKVGVVEVKAEPVRQEALSSNKDN